MSFVWTAPIFRVRSVENRIKFVRRQPELATLSPSCLVQTVHLSGYFYKMNLVVMWTKTALISAIYRKSLVVIAESTSGEIVNLRSVDAQKISATLPYLNILWFSPLLPPTRIS